MKVITIAIIPIVTFILGLFIISRVSKTKIIGAPQLSFWQQFPLNFRFYGYNKDKVEAYWNELQKDEDINALENEEKALEIDLLFPLAYGLTTIVSSLCLWYQLEKPFLFSGLLAFLPMIITMIADWIENIITLKQLRQFNRGNSLDESQIRIASIATFCKIIGFLGAYLYLLYLSCLVVES